MFASEQKPSKAPDSPIAKNSKPSDRLEENVALEQPRPLSMNLLGQKGIMAGWSRETTVKSGEPAPKQQSEVGAGESDRQSSSSTNASKSSKPNSLGGNQQAQSITVAQSAASQKIETLGGYWETTTYQPVFDANQNPIGVEIRLWFHPESPTDATKIGLVQMVRSIENGMPTRPNDPSGTISSRTTQDDYRIDTWPHTQSPVYATQDPPGNNAPTLADGVDPSGDNNYTQMDYGARYYSSGNLTQEPAVLWDKPRIPNGGANSNQIFETTALAVEGNQAGTYYGSVRWGWKKDNQGNFSIVDLSVVSKGVPTETFMEAAERWNASQTSQNEDSIDLPIVDDISNEPEAVQQFYQNGYDDYMEKGYEAAERGQNNPSTAYDEYNNAIVNFQWALQCKPNDPIATAKIQEFQGYRDAIRVEYDRFMQQGWEAIQRGLNSTSPEGKRGEYNTALINFERALERIASDPNNAAGEIVKVKGFLNQL